MARLKYFCLFILFIFNAGQASAQLQDLREDSLFFNTQYEGFRLWLEGTSMADFMKADSLKINPDRLELDVVIYTSAKVSYDLEYENIKVFYELHYKEFEEKFAKEFNYPLKDFVQDRFLDYLAIDRDSVTINYRYSFFNNIALEEAQNNTINLNSNDFGDVWDNGGFGSSNDWGAESAESYRVLFVKGQIELKNKKLSQGMSISSNDKITFNSPQSIALVMGNQKGRFYLRPQKGAEKRSELSIFVSEVLIPVDYQNPLKVKKRLSVR